MSFREFYVQDDNGKQVKAAEFRCTTEEFTTLSGAGYAKGHTTCYVYSGASKGNLYVWDGTQWVQQNS